MEKSKEPVFRYFVQKDGQKVNIDTLTPEERKYVGTWAYRELVKGFGYNPVEKQ